MDDEIGLNLNVCCLYACIFTSYSNILETSGKKIFKVLRILSESSLDPEYSRRYKKNDKWHFWKWLPTLQLKFGNFAENGRRGMNGGSMERYLMSQYDSEIKNSKILFK